MKMEPVNCLCRGKFIVDIWLLKVNTVRRHRPKNEILIKYKEIISGNLLEIISKETSQSL